MKVIFALILGVGLSGCMSFAPSPFQRGNVVLAGDADGIESLMDGLNGFVANGNTNDPVGNSAHWEHRKHQEMQRSRRQGVLQKVMGMEAK
jgi:hypothetical protein